MHFFKEASALLALSLFHQTTTGAPTSATQYKAQQVSATFDELPQQPLVASVGASIGPYKSLIYNTFQVQTPTEINGKVLTGLQPQTSPNYASFGLLGVTTLAPSNITSKYAGSEVDHWDFQQFYYGCFEGTANQAVVVPIACTITVKGYAGSKQVASQSFKFTPTGAVVSNLVKGVLSKGFAGITTAVFEQTVPDVIPTVDSLSYKTYNVTK